MDGGAWWAAVYGVAQSRTRLRRLSVHACIGEGNGNPLQCSCLENPRDGGAWWAAIYGVAQSQARLKRLSSSQLIETTLLWLQPMNELSDIIQVVFFASLHHQGSPLDCFLVLTSMAMFLAWEVVKCKHWRCRFWSQVALGLFSNTSLSRYLALKNLQLFYVLFSSFLVSWD